MDDTVNIRVLLEYLIKRAIIRDIKLIKRWPLTTDELNAIENLFGRIVEIVGDDDFISRLQ